MSFWRAQARSPFRPGQRWPAFNPCGPGTVFPASVRADFPIASVETYMNSAALHPLGTFASRAVEQTPGVPPARRRRGPRGLRRGEAGGPQEALRPADWRRAHRDRLHRQHLRRREHRRAWASTWRRRAATSSSTSCTSRRRSTCTRSSRRKASSSASSSIATGRSISTTWTRRSIATRASCRWRSSRTSTATCTTARR